MAEPKSNHRAVHISLEKVHSRRAFASCWRRDKAGPERSAGMKPGREVIEVNFEELESLLERARQGPLREEDCQRLQAAIHTLSYLIELIGEKDTTISRLRALLVKPGT